jgi:nitrite reductase (NADH) small subunit/3-phenylpropionate/trans-cinnamate dioxygenase ferredoxin subunit
VKHVVASVDEIPVGAHRVVEAAGRQFGVFNVDGRFYALQGACLHLEGPLGEGTVDPEHYLTCPWHGWKYHVKTGKNDFDLAIEARTYEVRVEDGEVKVALG